jgi:Arc/MetJ-type ribon-helix-helix transcriptional regulator
MVRDLDKWVEAGRFASRSEAVKTIVALYNERERVRTFYEMLSNRSREAKENPADLLPLEEVS